MTVVGDQEAVTNPISKHVQQSTFKFNFLPECSALKCGGSELLSDSINPGMPRNVVNQPKRQEMLDYRFQWETTTGPRHVTGRETTRSLSNLPDGDPPFVGENCLEDSLERRLLGKQLPDALRVPLPSMAFEEVKDGFVKTNWVRRFDPMRFPGAFDELPRGRRISSMPG